MEEPGKNPVEEKKSVFVRKTWLSPIFYVYFLSLLIALGMLYIHRENMVNRNSIAPDVAIDSAYNKPIGNMPPAPEGSSEKIDVSTLLQPTKAQLETGGQLFKIYCASCHGLDGKGDGPAAASLKPKPRDFRSTAGWINGRLLSDMLKTVSEGITGSAMVSFAASISASDRLAILDYIRASFGDFPKDMPAQLQEMNKVYHLGQPQAPETRMSITEAMSQIEESAIPCKKMSDAVANYIAEHPDENGSQIFNNVAFNKQRALVMLAASDFWIKNESDFVNLLTADAVQNGFDPKVADLSAQDWNTLYNYLKDLFSKQNMAQKNS